MNRFEGKTVVVTGGSSGIGRATATRFASEGANVAIVSRNKEAGQTAVVEIQSTGGSASFYQADIVRRDEVDAAMAAVVARYGRIDMAFNNAGLSGVSGTFDELSDDDFDAIVRTNLHGVFYCMRHQIRHFLERGIRGAIVNCASVSGIVGFPYQTAYSASKHAVVGLTRSVALEYAGRGIRVNAICPGGVATPMLKQFLRTVTPDRAGALAPPAIGRGANPDEIANIVTWLCSDEASYVVGQAYAIDGGLTAC